MKTTTEEHNVSSVEVPRFQSESSSSRATNNPQTGIQLIPRQNPTKHHRFR